MRAHQKTKSQDSDSKETKAISDQIEKLENMIDDTAYGRQQFLKVVKITTDCPNFEQFEKLCEILSWINTEREHLKVEVFIENY